MDQNSHGPELFSLIRAGDRGAFARAITLVESTRGSDREAGTALVEQALPFSGKAIRIGITGIPGVGKSTLINSFGLHAISCNHRVAVLATDPSSTRSGGSILGDKTRMEELSRSEKAFIRPTPSGGYLGGVARRTRESIILCEAAGYDLVLVETVGVGQSELEVDRMTDLNLLLMIPGAGDELQGIKRGIMESADVIVLTKADDVQADKRIAAQNGLNNAIPFLPLRENGRHPSVLLTDGITGKGIPELLQHILELNEAATSSGYLAQRRQAQNVHWMEHALREGLIELMMQDHHLVPIKDELKARVRAGSISPFQAANELLDRFRKGAEPLP